jgi:Mg2+/citrate symporter
MIAHAEPASELNLAQLISKNHKYEIAASNESAEDAAARRALEAADAQHQRLMRTSLFYFALLIVLVVFTGCVYVFASGNADDKKWAAGTVSAIASGLVGFLVGQTKK